jgi:hypothetical protein
MKLKEIEVGERYILSSSKKSRVGCSEEFFELFKGCELRVLKKLNSHTNKNTVYVEGLNQIGNYPTLVSFWCSPYDLKRSNSNGVK